MNLCQSRDNSLAWGLISPIELALPTSKKPSQEITISLVRCYVALRPAQGARLTIALRKGMVNDTGMQCSSSWSPRAAGSEGETDFPTH